MQNKNIETGGRGDTLELGYVMSKNSAFGKVFCSGLQLHKCNNVHNVECILDFFAFGRISVEHLVGMFTSLINIWKNILNFCANTKKLSIKILQANIFINLKNKEILGDVS